jgi:hypothetical protein
MTAWDCCTIVLMQSFSILVCVHGCCGLPRSTNRVYVGDCILLTRSPGGMEQVAMSDRSSHVQKVPELQHLLIAAAP